MGQAFQIPIQYCYLQHWTEESEPVQKQCAVLGVTGDGSRVQCCKEQTQWKEKH